jgi:hypothetical protein
MTHSLDVIRRTVRSNRRCSVHHTGVGIALLLLLAGCGGDNGGSPVEPSTIGISALPAAVSLNAGDATVPSIGITIARSGPSTDPVTLALEGAPAGVTATFAPNPVAAGATTAQLVLTSTIATPVGVSPLTIRATAGSITASTSLALTITPRPDFSLSIDSTRLTVPTLASGESTIRLVRTGGFAAPVALSATAPAGIAVRFGADTLRGATGSTTVGVTVGAAVAAGNYSITIVGRSAGLSDRQVTLSIVVPVTAGAVQLRVTPRNIVAQKGRTTTARLVITRVAPFAGPVTLTAPSSADVTVAFAPSVIAAGDSIATLSVTVAASTTSRVEPRTITAAGVGASPGSATLGINIVDAESGALAVFNDAEPVSLAAGSAITVPVEFQRPPQNGTGAITLSTVVNPNDGIAIRFVPSVVAGNTARAEISVPGTTPPGNYLVSFGLNLGGFVDQRPTVVISVLPRVGENATIRFCDPGNRPFFFAVQDDDGPWRPIVRTGNDYVFTVSGNRIGIAFVRRAASNSVNTFIRLRYLTRAELADIANVECETLFTGSRALSASFAGLAADERTLVSYTQGFSDSRISFSTVFAPPGPLTVRFSRYGADANRRVLRDVVVRRNLGENEINPIAPVVFGSSEAIPAVPIAATTTNLGTDSVYWTSGLHAPGVTRFFPGTFAGFYFLGQGGNAAVTPHFALGAATLPSGELQDVTATAYSGPTTDLFRQASVLFRTAGDRTVTFADVSPPFSWSLVGEVGNVRPRVTGLLPGVGARAVGAAMRQNVTTLSAIIIDLTATTGWLGSSAFDVQLPDFRGLPGWDPQWTVQRGVPVSVFEDTYGTSGGSIWQPLFDGMRQTRNTRSRSFTLP